MARAGKGGLCEACIAPGACCRDLTLYRDGGKLLTVWDDSGPIERMAEDDLPFEPLELIGQWTVPDSDAEDAGRSYSAWTFRCTALTAEGRCSIYDRRPQLCRDFLPGSSPLCVHYVPPVETDHPPTP